MRGKGSPYPPQIPASLTLNHTFRFQLGTSGVTSTITLRDIGDLLCVATASNAAYQIASAFKIHWVELWGSVGGTGGLTNFGSTISLDWAGTTAGTFGSNAKITDTCVGTARIPHIRSKPPKMSQLREWQPVTGAAALFEVVLPPYGIIDVNITFVLRDSVGQQSVSNTVTAATAGQLYCRDLDSTTNFLLVPVSFPNI